MSVKTDILANEPVGHRSLKVKSQINMLILTQIQIIWKVYYYLPYLID